MGFIKDTDSLQHKWNHYLDKKEALKKPETI